MTDVEARVLQNQVDIMWVLHLALGKMLPELVGRAGELDAMRDDLVAACKETKTLLSVPRHQRGGSA